MNGDQPIDAVTAEIVAGDRCRDRHTMISKVDMAVTIKNDREIQRMREAGAVVSVVHQRIEEALAPGVTTQDLDDIARDTFAEMGATSLFLGHLGFHRPDLRLGQ